MPRNESIVRNLNNAVATMREACDSAERAIKEGPDGKACREVMRYLVWGLANASNSVESAMMWVEWFHEKNGEPVNSAKD